MNKILGLLIASFAVISLVACRAAKPASESMDDEPSSLVSDTSIAPNSSVEPAVSSSSSSSMVKSSISSVASGSLDSTSSSEASSSLEPSSSVLPSSSENPVGSSEISSSDESSSSPVGTYYHVKFVNYDDSVLYEVDVPEGEDAEYKGEDPERPDDEEFTYEFIGWDKELTNIQSDLTAIAQFNDVAKENWGPIIWF